MSRLFPFRSVDDDREVDPLLVEIDQEDAELLFDALASETARSIVAALYEDPRTASELADEVDATLQTVSYHLRKFEEADLIEEVGTARTETGNTATVYGPTSDPLVLTAGRKDRRTKLREYVREIIGAVGILVGASFVVDRMLGATAGPVDGGVDDGGAGGGPTPTPPGPVDGLEIPPGTVFLAGGLLVLALVVGWVWARNERA
jgi:DNA-binding transcriptional ArsR family regulator